MNTCGLSANLGFFWIFLVLSVASSAWAQAPAVDDEQRARELFENGVILYDEAQYEQAILAWQEAYRLSQRPLFHFNIANAYERLGDLESALDYLHRYRAYAPAEERGTLERRIRTIETRLEDQRAAQRERERQEAEARRLEEESRAAERTPEGETTATVPMPEPAEDQRGGGGRAALLSTFGAATFVAAGVGGFFALRASADKRDLQGLCRSGICPQRAESVRDSEARHALIADISFGVAALALGGLVTSAILTAPGRRESREATAFQPVLRLDAQGAGLGLQGRF